MTFETIVDTVMDRQNLSSADARARVEQSVNERYRWLRTACGLQVTTQDVQEAKTEVGNRLITFQLAKVRRVFLPMAPTQPWVLDEQTMNYMRVTVPTTDPPRNYALFSWGAKTVTLYLDSIPGSVYPVLADGDRVVQKLEGDMIPSFPEDFHDILIYGAMEVEYQKKNDADNAERMLGFYIKRRDELIHRIAISGFLQIHQNKFGARTGSVV